MNNIKQRNPLAFHPLMKKGGTHKKTRGAERLALKQKTRHLVAQSCEKGEWKQ